MPGADFCRAMISDDPSNQGATQAAFDSLYYVVAKCLAKQQGCQVAAIVPDLPKST